MRLIRSPQQIQKICLRTKAQDKTIAVVPTMGYLHEGHLTLLRKARKKADLLILTLFVNPTQFGPKEDLKRYPRDLLGDLAKAKACGVDLVFAPNPNTMYPKGYQTYVEVTGLSQTLCGKSRPDHFRGVATIVCKLFQLTCPDHAFFGLKDFQQFAVIKSMVKDLNIPVKLIGVPTVREQDGLAMSSRNVYLSANERRAALSLSIGLKEIQKQIQNRKRDLKTLLGFLRKKILSTRLARIDYVECVDADTLQPLQKYKRNKTLFVLAVFFGKTRLIDNMVV